MSRMTRAALLLAVCALIPASASAQLGKFTKKATEAAAGAAGVSTTAPKYVPKVNITSAQLAAVNKGLEAEVAQAPGIIKAAEEAQKDREKAQAKYDKDMQAYNAAYEKWQACRDRVVAADTAEATSKAKKAEDASNIQLDEEQMQAMALRAQQAAQRIQAGTGTAEDQKAVTDFQKYMARVQGQAMGSMSATNEAVAFNQATIARIEKTCGREPQKPANPNLGSGKMAQEQISDAGAAASGIAKPQWFAMRDEAIALASSNTRVQGGAGTPNDEADAINQQIVITQKTLEEIKKKGLPY